VAVVVPVQQHGTQRGHQTISDITRSRCVVIFFFGQNAAQRGDTRAHHVHGMGRGWQPFEYCFYIRREAAQRLEFLLVCAQLGVRGQLAMHQQMRDLFEFTGICDIEDVVATVVQIIAGLADGAQRRVTCSDAREGD